ncbi:MAG: radical SAM protein [Eubacteriales bacterium]
MNYEKEEIIEKISGCRAKKLCIFGAGTNGKLFCEKFKKVQFEIDSFCDNNSELHGEFIHGFPCISLEILQQDKEETLVVVSPDESEGIVSLLKEKGFPFVVLKDEINFYEYYIENIELNIVNHCDLDCQFCSHFSSIAPEYCVPFEALEKDIKRLRELAINRLLNVKIIGGEPLLHPELDKIMGMIRENLPKTQIQLVTNAVKLMKQPESFWLTCQKNDIVITPTKYPVSLDFEGMEKKAKKYQVKYRYYNNAEVVKTMWKSPLDLDGNQTLEKSYDICKSARYCGMLMEGKQYICPITANANIFIEKFQVPMKVTEKDYLDIHSEITCDDFVSFINNPTPFCRYCKLSERTLDHPWKRTTGKAEEWL